MDFAEYQSLLKRYAVILVKVDEMYNIVKSVLATVKRDSHINLFSKKILIEAVVQRSYRTPSVAVSVLSK